MSEPTVYTWGYSRSRTQKDIINCFPQRVPGQDTYVDVRDVRRERKTRNPAWRAEALGLSRRVSSYTWERYLGNYGNGARWTRHKSALLVNSRLYEIAVRATEMARQNSQGEYQYVLVLVLVCCEGNALKPSGRPNCHRVEVAQAIADLCGGRVVHL